MRRRGVGVGPRWLPDGRFQPGEYSWRRGWRLVGPGSGVTGREAPGAVCEGAGVGGFTAPRPSRTHGGVSTTGLHFAWKGSRSAFPSLLVGEGFSASPKPKWEGWGDFSWGNPLLFTITEPREGVATNECQTRRPTPESAALSSEPGAGSSRSGTSVWSCRQSLRRCGACCPAGKGVPF